jgi:hypothetical protein
MGEAGKTGLFSFSAKKFQKNFVFKKNCLPLQPVSEETTSSLTYWREKTR